jgi:hypothetical protein
LPIFPPITENSTSSTSTRERFEISILSAFDILLALLKSISPSIKFLLVISG